MSAHRGTTGDGSLHPPFHTALLQRARERPAEPIITWYGAAGARTELSAVTFANAVAKTTGALVDEWEVPPGATIRLDLPLHWQLPVWLAASDAAGLTVVADGPADVVVAGTAADARADDPQWAVVTSLSPYGLPGAELPADVYDHARDSLGQPDVRSEPGLGGTWRAAGRTWSAADVAAAATPAGAGPADRLLVSQHVPVPERWWLTWARPVLTGGSVVLASADAAPQVAAAEQVTHVLPAEP